MFKRFLNLFKPITVSVYRCSYCGKIVTDWQVKKGIFCNCGANKIVQTYPTLLEKIKIMGRYVIKGY